MRNELEKLEDVRDTFVGTFVKFSIKNGYKGIERTVLLKDIKDVNGKILTDHLRFNLTKGFQELNLAENDTIQFDARIKEYEKGYKGYREDIYKPIEIDYKLSHPTKMRKI